MDEVKRVFLPVIIASYNRPNLIKQTVESCLANSYHDVYLVIVDNSDDPETVKYLKSLKNITLFRWPKNKRIFPHLQSKTSHEVFSPFKSCLPHSVYYNNEWSLGKQRTKGEMIAPPSEYIYFSDNDVYFLPDWDKLMVGVLEKYEDIVLVGGVGQHGQERRGRIDENHTVGIAGKQAGNTMLFRRREWARIGYFPDYDEDSWIGNEITTQFNKKIGVIDPPVIIHCGANSVIHDNKRVEGIQPTFDTAAVELSKLNYPEVVFE